MSSWNSSYVAEALSVMIQKEQTVYRISDYLHQPSSSSSVASPSLRAVDEDVRTTMVDWCYSFIDVCKFERESVAMAMHMVDRFLSKSTKAESVLRDRMEFQLLTMTSLYVTTKTHGKTALGIDCISTICQNLYTDDEIVAMELTLLNELEWRISPPTCVQMAHHILSLIAARDVSFDKTTWDFILDEIKFQAENAVRDYNFVTQRPSTLAIAAMLNALEQLDKKKCRSICRALVSITNDEFDSIEIILDMKRRLFSLVYGQKAEAEDESCREVDALL